MAWNTVLVEQLRYYIYDLDSSNYTWTNVQLEKFLAVAAVQVFSDLIGWVTYINGPYTVDTSTTGSAMISPDPVSTAPLGVSNLIVLKAACIIGKSDLRRIGNTGGWKITDDRSTIDGTKAVENIAKISDDACKGYKEALDDFKRGNMKNAGAVGKAILSPYQSPNSSRSIPHDLGSFPNQQYRG